MPKRMHDISMDRVFGVKSISMNSDQLCAMNGGVYTLEDIEKHWFSCKRDNSLFSGP